MRCPCLARLETGGSESLHKGITICIIPKDFSALYSTHNNMLKRTRGINSGFSWHFGSNSCKTSHCQSIYQYPSPMFPHCCSGLERSSKLRCGRCYRILRYDGHHARVPDIRIQWCTTHESENSTGPSVVVIAHAIASRYI